MINLYESMGPRNPGSAVRHVIDCTNLHLSRKTDYIRMLQSAPEVLPSPSVVKPWLQLIQSVNLYSCVPGLYIPTGHLTHSSLVTS